MKTDTTVYIMKDEKRYEIRVRARTKRNIDKSIYVAFGTCLDEKLTTVIIVVTFEVNICSTRFIKLYKVRTTTKIITYHNQCFQNKS